MLQIVTIFKAMIEVALLAFMGQGILFIMAGSNRDKNLVFAMLKTVTMPVTKFIRFVSPGIVMDRHIPLASFILLIVLWAGLTMAKVMLVLQARQ
jgi:hypothetical protein